MAYKVIYFHRTETLPQTGGRDLLVIRLKDEQGSEYSWAPRWDDLRNTFHQAYLVESRNAQREPEKFEALVRSLLAKQSIQDAVVIKGIVERLDKGNLVIDDEEIGVEYCYPVAFEIDKAWLMAHLGKTARCLIIDQAIYNVELI